MKRLIRYAKFTISIAITAWVFAFLMEVKSSRDHLKRSDPQTFKEAQNYYRENLSLNPLQVFYFL